MASLYRASCDLSFVLQPSGDASTLVTVAASGAASAAGGVQVIDPTTGRARAALPSDISSGATLYTKPVSVITWTRWPRLTESQPHCNSILHKRIPALWVLESCISLKFLSYLPELLLTQPKKAFMTPKRVANWHRSSNKTVLYFDQQDPSVL